jgi:hypothetical protein
VNFSNGTIAAGDAYVLALYGSGGNLISKLSLPGKSLNFGLTPISKTYGIDSQENGVLTLVNLSKWTSAGTLVLQDPGNTDSLQLVSPSSGGANVLYAVAQNKSTGEGFLFSVSINPATGKLKVNSYFAFIGQSGASPVVVTPSVTGLSSNLILLHVPGLIDDATPENRLLGVLDSATGLKKLWAVTLTAPLIVSPTVDSGSMSLFYHQNYSPLISQVGLLTGNRMQSFNLQTISGLPSPLALNAHLNATQYGSVFTLLLGGGYTSAPGVGAEYVMAFQPLISPTALMWLSQMSSEPVSSLAAWNFAPSSETGVVCPIAITNNSSGSGDSAIVRFCDF